MTENERPRCFVIMPIADTPGYETSHFSRVYEHLLKPAILKAGYQPIRADDTVKTDYIVVGIIQKIVDAEMVICDLSSRNPNVMYELGIRHAFNKPVALIKDKKTDKVFDIQGLRYIEYDETLRIDSVQKEISRISESVLETSNHDDKVINSVVQLAGIKTAEIPDQKTVSLDTQLILSAIGSIENRINSIEDRQNINKRYFSISDGRVIFSEDDAVKVGESIFDRHSNPVGILVSIDQQNDRLMIRSDNGKLYNFGQTAAKEKGFTSIPF